MSDHEKPPENLSHRIAYVNRMYTRIDTLLSDKSPRVLQRVQPTSFGLLLHLEDTAQGSKNYDGSDLSRSVDRQQTRPEQTEIKILKFGEKQFFKKNKFDHRRCGVCQEIDLNSWLSSELAFFTTCRRFNGCGSAIIISKLEGEIANVWHSWQ